MLILLGKSSYKPNNQKYFNKSPEYSALHLLDKLQWLRQANTLYNIWPLFVTLILKLRWWKLYATLSLVVMPVMGGTRGRLQTYEDYHYMSAFQWAYKNKIK